MMDKEKYLKPKVDTTNVEIGVYGTYCDGELQDIDGKWICVNT